MRHLLPLCALIVIASGCAAVRHDSDANFLPPVAADHSEIISDKSNSAEGCTPVPFEEAILDANEGRTSDAAAGSPDAKSVFEPKSDADPAPAAKKHQGLCVELKTFADGGRFSTGSWRNHIPNLQNGTRLFYTGPTWRSVFRLTKNCMPRRSANSKKPARRWLAAGNKQVPYPKGGAHGGAVVSRSELSR